VGLRIEVDRGRCMGSGECSYHAPGTFDLDDELKSVVIDPDGDPPEKIRLAADSCPTRAIEVHEA
jgi:ferredoxin